MLGLLLLLSPCLQGADELLGDLHGADVAAQERSIEALASALDHPGPSQVIADALSLQAEESAESLIRSASLKALGRRGDDASIKALSELVSALPPSEAPQAVTALGATPLGRARAWELLEGALGDKADRAPLVALLEVGVVSLVEGGRSTWTPSELSPLVRLYLHPEESVRRGVLLGINAALEVLDGAAESRAIAFLEALEESGLSSTLLLGTRVELALLLGETSRQEGTARLLAEGSGLEMDPLSAVRGYGYLGTASFIDGDYEEALELFLNQRDLAASIAKRPLSGDANLRVRELAARVSASAEVSIALARLADGDEADSAPSSLG